LIIKKENKDDSITGSAVNNAVKGIFITFEGIDGSGKTTQIKLLHKFLKEKGFNTVITREPGGTALGDSIRKILLDPKNNGPVARAEALLFEAARAELTEKVIVPALDKGEIVICDRFFDSTLAYQGFARGLGIDSLLDLSLWATSGLAPDITFLLSLDVSDSEKRLDRQSRKRDRIEHEDGDFKKKLQAGYIELAGRFKDRIVLIDANKGINKIFSDIRANMLKLLINRKWLTQ
jgi:dTMP kinase